MSFSKAGISKITLTGIFSTLILSIPVVAREIRFSSNFDVNDYKGTTYLQFMRESVKPAMDVMATDGYEISCDAASVESAYTTLSEKVRTKIDRNFGGLDHVKTLLVEIEGSNVNLNTLPGIIRRFDPSKNSYDFATVVGLLCGGGVRINYDANNYGLNIHYDTTEERSGRSFGVGPTRGANDASDKQYLTDLQKYASDHSEDLSDFYSTLLKTLLNNDAAGYSAVEDEGQTVLTDFLSVYTAEQARNLMDGEVSPHWDAALLEVTLIAGFHAGQNEFKLFYSNPETKEVSFTNKTLRQTPCAVPTGSQVASLKDYWQFSRNITDPSNCKRSGINITKREFRKLGTAITQYMLANHPTETTSLLEAMEASVGVKSNAYESLSKYLISDSASASISPRAVTKVTKLWTEFLVLVQAEAEAISAELDAP
jgi:hypothetical protein